MKTFSCLAASLLSFTKTIFLFTLALYLWIINTYCFVLTMQRYCCLRTQPNISSILCIKTHVFWHKSKSVYGILIFTYYLITQNATLRQHCHAATHIRARKARHGRTLQYIKQEKKKHENKTQRNIHNEIKAHI